jgi:polyisoprenoid-binding protein YceI|tara:strand:- start:2135 stop:2647 length:513 start_codon:yes stop_codon:yes gene_type:complete
MNFIALFFLLTLSFAQNLDFTSSEIRYYGYHVLHDWVGVSTNISSNVFYDSSSKTGSASVKVRLDSFDSKLYSRDSNMLYYTNAIDFPEVVFESTEAKVVDDSVYIQGDLTFHGVTKKIKTTAHIELNDIKRLSGSFQIKLSDFNVKRPSLMFIAIEDNMRIEYSFKSTQ